MTEDRYTKLLNFKHMTRRHVFASIIAFLIVIAGLVARWYMVKDGGGEFFDEVWAYQLAIGAPLNFLCIPYFCWRYKLACNALKKQENEPEQQICDFSDYGL